MSDENPSASASTLQSALESGLEAKKAMDEQWAKLLNLANIPTLEDMGKVRERVQSLEDQLRLMSMSLEDALKRLEKLSPQTEEKATAASKPGARKLRRRRTRSE